MDRVDCTLLGDGPSDAVLTPVVQWVLQQQLPEVLVQCEWADLVRLRSRPTSLAERIQAAVDFYPCKVLFVHRDAEAQLADWRYSEIAEAAQTIGDGLPIVCVVPVRMQEAWLLLDETAIRRAAGNPNGKALLDLPQPGKIEALPDPKARLENVLCAASGLKGRRLKKFRPGRVARFVTDYMADFACLRQLPAFRRLENDVQAVADELRVR